jgi:hypothetical protein
MIESSSIVSCNDERTKKENRMKNSDDLDHLPRQRESDCNLKHQIRSHGINSIEEQNAVLVGPLTRVGALEAENL